MRESFGARLRRRREDQQIDLSAIAADTKIKQSLLEALERDDVSGWPSGIFRRAYVRAYARAINLPADDVLTEFMVLYPEPEQAEPLSASFSKSGEPETWRERMWQFGRRAPQIAVPASPPARAAAPAPPQSVGAPQTAMSGETDEMLAATEARASDGPDDAVRAPEPRTAASFEPDLAALASLCTRLGQVEDTDELVRALEHAAQMLNAVGVILWVGDESGAALVPAFAHGYPPRVMAHLRSGIARDDDNATASAVRARELRVVKRADGQNGAVVAPLLRTGGCVGALAIELRDGVEQLSSLHDMARIIAAQLATLFNPAAAGHASTEAEPAPYEPENAADDARHATGGA